MGRKRASGSNTRQSGRRPDLSILPAPDSVRGQHYYYVTQRFWPSLVFLLPMLVFIFVGSLLRDPGPADLSNDLVATYLVERLVNAFGGRGFVFLPGLLVVAILLACHLVAKHPWRFDPWVLPGMLGESLTWTIPLFMLNRVLHTALVAGADTGPIPWFDQVVRSLGAGIYEEMVFRFICMNVLHMLLVDLGKLPRSPSDAAVIFASAVIFAAQHHPPLGADPFDALEFTFRTGAGLFLAGLFFYRGFGIAAGCHAFYNVIVVTLGAVQT